MASHPWPSLFATRRRVWCQRTAGPARAGQDPRRETIPQSPENWWRRARGRVVTYAVGMTDTAVQDVTWNLEDLVDGGGAGRLRRPAGRGRRARRGLRRPPTPAASPSSTAAGLADRDDRARRDRRPRRPRAANYAHLRFAADTEDEANGALVAKVTELATGDRDEARVLRPRVGGGRRRRRRRAARGGRASSACATTCAPIRRYRPHLLSEAEEKLMAEKSVTGREAWSRLFSEQTSAIRVDLPGRRRGRRRSTLAHEPPAASRPRDAPGRRRGGQRRAAPRACARAPTSSTRSPRTRRPTTGCAPTRPGCRAATSATRPATSRCARCWRPSRAPTTCRSAGTG